MSQHEIPLRRLYDAFNARDLAAIAGILAPGVAWHDAVSGGTFEGRDAVLAHLEAQFATLDPALTPRAFADRPDGRVAVALHQLVRDLQGTVLSENGDVKHLLTFDGALLSKLEIEG